VVPVTDVKREALLVDVTLEVAEGKQAFVDRIEIAGNTKTRDKVLRRELLLVEGNVYNSQALAASKKNLENLGFFEEVKTESKRGSADDKVNVSVEVKEKATGQFTVGAGFSSLEGPLGSVGISQSNFLGLGQSLSLSSSLSAKTLRFNLAFVEPHLLDTEFSTTITGYNERLNYKDFTGFNEDRRGGGIGFGRRLTPNLAGSVAYRIEQVQIRDVASDASPQTQLALITNGGESVTSSATLGFTWDGRDAPRDPTRGLRVSGTGTLAGGPLGFDNNFYKAIFDVEYYHPLFWRVVGRLHGNIAFGDGFNSTPLLPVQERFYLGGASSVRGFKNFSISPKDPTTGAATGGNKAYFINHEIIFPILEQFNVRGLLFFDLGNAWDERSGFQLSLRRSAGPGIRLNTPLGTVGVIMGFNLGRKQGEKRTVFTFTVGSSF
jgi:outer membrane protein insertion porin family